MDHALTITSRILLNVLTHLTKKLLFIQLFNTVTSLVETCVTLVAVNHTVFVLTLGTKTNLTVSLEQLLELLHTSQPKFTLLPSHFFDSLNLQSLFQHLLCFIPMTSLKIKKHLSHPQLSSNISNFLLKLLSQSVPLFSLLHPIPILQISLLQPKQLLLPQLNLSVDLHILRCQHIVVQ